MNSDWSNFILSLIDKFIQYFGPWGTVALFVIVLLALGAYILYSDYRKNREVNLALEEKERTIQSLANQVRVYRTLELKEKYNWSIEEVERLLITKDFKNPKEARDFLENKDRNK